MKNKFIFAVLFALVSNMSVAMDENKEVDKIEHHKGGKNEENEENEEMEDNDRNGKECKIIQTIEIKKEEAIDNTDNKAEDKNTKETPCQKMGKDCKNLGNNFLSLCRNGRDFAVETFHKCNNSESVKICKEKISHGCGATRDFVVQTFHKCNESEFMKICKGNMQKCFSYCQQKYQDFCNRENKEKEKKN